MICTGTLVHSKYISLFCLSLFGSLCLLSFKCSDKLFCVLIIFPFFLCIFNWFLLQKIKLFLLFFIERLHCYELLPAFLKFLEGLFLGFFLIILHPIKLILKDSNLFLQLYCFIGCYLIFWLNGQHFLQNLSVLVPFFSELAVQFRLSAWFSSQESIQSMHLILKAFYLILGILIVRFEGSNFFIEVIDFLIFFS